jgi:hypothetical protein
MESGSSSVYNHGSRAYRGAREDPSDRTGPTRGPDADHGRQLRRRRLGLLENDDGSDDVIGLAVGGKGDRALIPPDPGTFESYSQSG